MRRTAVIDLGSNSIKCLVAMQSRQGGLISAYENTLPVRISRGLRGDPPKLGPEQIVAGAEAVTQLFSECQRHGPIEEITIVATSAVREAANGAELGRLIYDQTGVPLRILGGDEEAELIGRGVVEDPLVTGQFEHYTVADLGGGSLELIALADGAVTARVSLPLGAVRLTERFVPALHERLSDEQCATIDRHVRDAIQASGFPLQGPLIGTGGLITVWRSMDAHALNVTLPERSPHLERSSLRKWIELIRPMSWPQRLAVPGLPASRADIILPGMLITDAILDLAGVDEVIHSRFNLRFGVAAAWFADHPRS